TAPNPNHQDRERGACQPCTDELANASKWSVCSLEIRFPSPAHSPLAHTKLPSPSHPLILSPSLLPFPHLTLRFPPLLLYFNRCLQALFFFFFSSFPFINSLVPPGWLSSGDLYHPSPTPNLVRAPRKPATHCLTFPTLASRTKQPGLSKDLVPFLFCSTPGLSVSITSAASTYLLQLTSR
ncbi:hypothetical protein M419DRAFT_86709, partial [Trichoderma reesei RUT C-30]